MDDTAPVFVRGVSRSGGTLMVTILDVHPDIAMSYELYPDMLKLPDPSPEYLGKMADRLARGASFRKLGAWTGHQDFTTYIARLPRGGLDEKDLLTLLREQIAAGMGFRTTAERLRFMERCCVVKMRRLGKKRWGLKSTSRFEEYLELWPDAQFINMIRDGRDVLASKLNVGNFDKDPARVGKGWAGAMKRFRKLMQTHPAQAHPVVYEKLATDPEPVIRELCQRLGIAYVPELLAFHQQDLTIFQTTHLSGDRISKPIDASRVGRWRKDVSPAQLESFYSTARDMMIAYGYLEDEHAG